MPIVPLAQFEADLEEDRKVYENLKPPTSIVVRFGAMKMVGEFPYSGDLKPGCGSKFVVKTHRGTEIGEMLTSTCPNAGCSKSVTRKEMLEYIENSGGKDYPFFAQGKVLRLASVEDLNEQTRLDGMKPQMLRMSRAMAERMLMPIKLVEAEPILGQERLTLHFISEQRVDFRDLVAELAKEFHTRIDMHQVGARDEARLTADYERCGQHCCCKQFLKVLKPVSMKQAKIQKATLDPLKISGRCGRLMCCLRYEEQTYDDLRARLPKRKSRVQTPDGWATVLDGQILTQLVLVQLDSNGEQVAVAVEDLIKGGTPPPPPPPPSFAGPSSQQGPGGPVAGPGASGPRAPRREGRPPDRPVSSPRADRDRRPGPPQSEASTDASDGAPPAPRQQEPRSRDLGAQQRPIADESGPDIDNIDEIGEWDTGEGPTPAPRRDQSPRDGSRGPSGQRPPGPGGSGGGGGGPEQGQRRRRKRRRGRGGGGGGNPGASPGGGGGSGGGPPPSNPGV